MMLSGETAQAAPKGKHRKLSGKRTDSGQTPKSCLYSTEEAIPSVAEGRIFQVYKTGCADYSAHPAFFIVIKMTK